jgi:hypothetical protein
LIEREVELENVDDWFPEEAQRAPGRVPIDNASDVGFLDLTLSGNAGQLKERRRWRNMRVESRRR